MSGADCKCGDASCAAPFIAQEIAYYIPGKGWKRTVAKTQAAFDRKIEKLSEDVTEVRTRPWEG